MSESTRIGIIADYTPTNRYHKATADSLAHSGELLAIKVETVWLDTDKLDSDSAEVMLRKCDGLWGGTGSPYRSMEGALRSIRFARERGWPFIGT